MQALTYHGSKDVRVESVPDPSLVAPDDILLRVTATAICGSDLHIYRGKIPTMEHGDVLGHEFMGVVEDVGREVTRVKVGDRVVIPFVIACGTCFHCLLDEFAACENTNTGRGAILNAKKIRPPAALFGYSRLYGGIQGGQAELVRVPKANVIGQVGGGFSIAQKWIGEGRIRGHGARPVGIARRALDMMIEYSKVRSTFGRPLADRQAIQFMIADSAMELHAVRNMVYECAWRVDRGEDRIEHVVLIYTRAIARKRTRRMSAASSVTSNVVQMPTGDTSVVTGFLRYHVLMRVYDGDPDLWLLDLEKRGDTGGDVRFARWIRSRLRQDPSLLHAIRKMVDATPFWRVAEA